MSRPHAPRRCAHAFTLVELLTVVSIVGLLLGLVMPSFRAAREHARILTCQTQLSGISKSLIAYALEGDAFPITADANGTPCSWRYGGWTGTNTVQWKSYAQGRFYIPTGERPLSRYMHQNVGLSETEPMPVFRCPSDDRSSRSALPLPLRNASEPCYQDIGTSYHLNWHWFDLQTELPSAPAAQNQNKDRVPRGERIWWKYMDRNAARFITLIEDPADFGFREEKQTVGYHKKFSTHNFAFLDGHVEYLAADTRFVQERGRWTLIDESPPYKEWLPK